MGQGPPQNSGELINKAFMRCCECLKSLIEQSKRVFYCKTCSESLVEGDAVYWCKDCEKDSKHEHKLSKMKRENNNTLEEGGEEKNEETQKYLDNLFEEYHNLDYEDVIAGGQKKTRFNYTKVAQDDFGLTEQEILLLEDRQLNQLVSLKHYRPYKNVEESQIEQELTQREKKQQERADKYYKKGVNVHRVINLKKQYKNEV